MVRRVKIVATMGPSSQEPEVLRALISAGMDVARLNFSHGTHADHARIIDALRTLSAELKKPVAILQDLQGPKLRVGNLPPEGISLSAGDRIRLTHTKKEILAPSSPSEKLIPLEIPDVLNLLHPGDQILMDDGQIELVAEEIGRSEILARVKTGKILKSHKGVNFPGINLNIPPMTAKDLEDLAFGIAHRVDAVAISFVQRAEDIQKVRERIHEIDPTQADLPVIAKLERPEAIQNLDEILLVSDGVMVARGDLGVETDLSKVPVIQKRIIRSANDYKKFVITATQMLDSMIQSPRPTRAEASDVANAVFDGTDAVMLSGETASGAYPVESVQIMDHIIQDAETHYFEWGQVGSPRPFSPDDATTITLAAKDMADDRNVSSIAVFTLTGRTALLMSKARPRVNILGFTPEPRTYNRMALYWGVKSYLVPYANTVEAMLGHVDQTIIQETGITPGEQVVVISGFPVGAMCPPNLALLHTVGEAVDGVTKKLRKTHSTPYTQENGENQVRF